MTPLSKTRAFKVECEGIVAGLDAVEDNEDEARCLVWFDGEGDDNTQIKITVPAGSLQLRQELLVTIEPLLQSDRPEVPII